MTEPSAEKDRVAKLLRPWTVCDDGGRFDHGSSRAAEHLLNSDWLAERLAQTWDEAYGAGLDHEANRARDREWPVVTPNPYRVNSPGATTGPGGL